MMVVSCNITGDEVSKILLDVFEIIQNDDSLMVQLRKVGADIDLVRELISSIFDQFDNPNTEKYIGILEWSLVRQIVDNAFIENKWFFIDEIIERFAGHPDVRMMNCGCDYQRR